MEEVARINIESALLLLGDAQEILRTVHRFTDADIPDSVFGNLGAVVAELHRITADTP